MAFAVETYIGIGVGLAVGVGLGVASGGLVGAPAPGKHGWATVVVPTAGPGVLRLVLPTTVAVPGEALPTVAPTAGMPVVAPVPVAVVPVAAAPGLHGPETVLIVDPIVLLGAPGSAPTGLLVVAGTPPAAGVVTGFWLGVVVVFWLGVTVVV
jgi:hypothetical protein